jgi:hypothetical protein
MISIQEQNLKETTSEATVSYVQKLNGRKRYCSQIFQKQFVEIIVCNATIFERTVACRAGALVQWQVQPR